MYIFIDIYIVYSFCTTLPIVWQRLSDLGSCKAMMLVILLIVFLFFYIYFFFFEWFILFFFSLLPSPSFWHHLFHLEVREGHQLWSNCPGCSGLELFLCLFSFVYIFLCNCFLNLSQSVCVSPPVSSSGSCRRVLGRGWEDLRASRGEKNIK